MESQFLGDCRLLAMSADDPFRARLDQMIDLSHPLTVLASRMQWTDVGGALAPAFEHRDRDVRTVGGADLFGPTLAVAGACVSNAGHPGLPIRLMVAQLYLKRSYSVSNSFLVERWAQDAYFQFLSPQAYFAPCLPCDSAQVSRSRCMLAKTGVVRLLEIPSQAVVSTDVVKMTEFERVTVDSTVRSKAIGHPTDSRLPAAGNRPWAGRQSCQAPRYLAKNDPRGRSQHLQVRRECQLVCHAPARLDGARWQPPRQPVRRPHAGRTDRMDLTLATGHRREDNTSHRGPGLLVRQQRDGVGPQHLPRQGQGAYTQASRLAEAMPGHRAADRPHPR